MRFENAGIANNDPDSQTQTSKCVSPHAHEIVTIIGHGAQGPLQEQIGYHHMVPWTSEFKLYRTKLYASGINLVLCFKWWSFSILTKIFKKNCLTYHVVSVPVSVCVVCINSFEAKISQWILLYCQQHTSVFNLHTGRWQQPISLSYMKAFKSFIHN